MGQTSFDPAAIATSWLSSFSNALEAGDAQAAANCLITDGWLRESHIFTWDNRTIHGRDKVSQYIAERLPRRTFSNFCIDTRPYLTPERGQVAPQYEGIKSGFTFETGAQWAQGYVKLIQDGEDSWKALSVYLAATDIKGHEESEREVGIYGGHTTPWPAVLSARRKQIEENPHALIIGAGHVGLMVAARFKQMNIPTLVIDAQPRLGDVWRNRYESLILHTTRMNDHFLYHRFPQYWPLHTPKDKLANWFEHYADALDLTVWTSTKTIDGLYPTYDEAAQRWTIVVDRAGQRVTLHPAHLVSCVGVLGPRIMPQIKNSGLFKGSIIHGGDFKTAAQYKDRHIVVVGAGNTGGDICIDVATAGAKSITLVQRSKSTLIPAEMLRNGLNSMWPDDGSIPSDVADFRAASTPYNLARSFSKINKAGGGGDSGKFAAMYAGIREKGMVVDDGEGGEGTAFQVLEKYGGFMLDVGCANLIISGRVVVKHGVEIAEAKEESVVFSDGSEIPADDVIFATGYHPPYANLVKIFGEEMAQRGGHYWGLDDEGELRGVYRPTGHPALWYGAGGMQVVRYGSKQLAMLVKARDLGLIET
ncbi:hypothetical protein NP233_g1442 [Leucocoprinus birnbaumii]|uniref:FAD/NAD(P)-binding domain-containing protein n=1 Tax=Leucocoprinus birnbaumii TaxID=56174 RepID=A0AAD5YZJ8_9AGAR|nr:hypothetical protein NP233_g1442 [Leucocoprinus birnbaumii]